MSSIRSRHTWALLLLLTAFFVPLWGQSQAGSNIASRTLLSSDGSSKIEHRVFDNGLGDVIQELDRYPGSSLPGLVVHHEYDDWRRLTKSWLPVTTSGSGFVPVSTVSSQAVSLYSDSYPFSRTVYDAFLPSQPSGQYKAGAQWQGNNKKVSSSYSEYVGVSMFSPEAGYLYILSDVKYFRRQLVDEDGSARSEYCDLNGRLLVSESSQGKTYYLYNPHGDITYVIPPVLSAYLVSHYGTASGEIYDSDAMMEKYAYVYRYDNHRHCIYKKLPGCAPVFYIYDKAGNCILTQDGNQRQRGEWSYSIPDRFGRPCISGTCQYSGSYSSEPLHSVAVYAEYDGVSTATGGYSVHNLTLSQQTLHAASYYDGYSFIGQHGVPSSLTPSSATGFTVDASLGQGLQTGSATAVLSEGAVTGYTYSAIYYDSRYNVSQVKSTDHLGRTDITYTSYSYTGKPLNVKMWHSLNSTEGLVKTCGYSYDGADRVSSCELLVARGAPVPSATLTYAYDALGRLSTVSRPFTTSVSHDVSYSYDLHGWPTGITTNSFCEELFYAGGPGTPRYSGNISSLRWQIGNSTLKRGYKFTYDSADRLTQATYGEGNSISNYGKFSEGVQYDANGNVTGITRYGKCSSSSYGLMDNLTLSYDGNRLTGVTETVADYDVAGSFEYKRSNGSQYVYDSNGSLVADLSRGIAYITYDVIGHPQTIYFTNGNETRYVYSALGEKLRVTHYVAKPNVTRAFGVKPEGSTMDDILFAGQTDYLLGGDLIIKNGMIDKVLFDGGYAKATAISPTTYDFAYFYYNKDHLGNNREVVNASGSVQQVTNYYPFGAPYADPNAVVNASYQPYKYNGKELDLMHGLNTYDYGARQYDPILCRWDRVDPLAEKDYETSPYAYCENDPVNAIDPDGRSSLKVLLKATYKIGKNVAKNGFSSLTKGATYASAFNDVVDDAKTVFDSNASTWDRAVAGVSLISEITSPISVKDIKFLGKTTKKIRANQGYAKPHGGKEHNKEIDNYIKNQRKLGSTEIRKNQCQVDAKGNKLGNNRPDVQFNDENGIHHNVEFDNSPKQSAKHKETIENNDPNSVNDFFLLLNSKQK